MTQRRGKALDIHPIEDLPQQRESESAYEARMRAARLGHKVYSALRPCRTCDTTVRYVYGGACVTCTRVYARSRYQQQRLQLLAIEAQVALDKAKTER